jgi:hypothetical protein
MGPDPNYRRLFDSVISINRNGKLWCNGPKENRPLKKLYIP